MDRNEQQTSEEAVLAFGLRHVVGAAANDTRAAASMMEAERLVAKRATTRRQVRLGALIVAIVHRINRVADLSAVLMSAARKDADAIAVAALADSPKPKKRNVKQ